MKFSALIAFLCLSLCIQAQVDDPFKDYKMSIEWSDVLEFDDGRYYDLIGLDDEYMYMKYLTKASFFSRSVTWYAKIRKDDYSLVWKSAIDEFPEYLGNESKFVEDFFSEGSVQILLNAYDRRKDEMYLLQMFINEDGSFSELYRVSAIKTDDDDEGEIMTFQDENSDEIIIGIVPQYEDEEENRLMYFSVLDSSLHEVWSRELEFDFSFEHSELIDFRAAANGDIMALFKLTPDEERGEEELDDVSNEHFYLMKASKDSAMAELLDLKLDSIWVTAIAFRNDNQNGKTMVTGLYSNEDEDQTAGSFVVDVSQHPFRILNSNQSLFSVDQLTPLIGRRDAEDGDEIDGTFELREILRKEDGSLITIFEDYRIVTHAYNDPNGMTTITYTHLFRSLLVCNYLPNGTLNWNAVVPKVYEGATTYYGGYLAVLNGDNLHLLYNDNEDSYEYWSGEEDEVDGFRLRNGVIAMVTIDPEGNVLYEVVGNTRDDDKLYFAPKRGIQSQSNGENAYWIRVNDEEFRLGRFRVSKG